MVHLQDSIVVNARTSLFSGNNHARLVLSEVPGITTYNAYVLDLWNGYSTLSLEGQTVAFYDFSVNKILSSSRDFVFWIRWKNPEHEGMITVGSGDVVGSGQFMSFVDPMPFDIHALAVNNGVTWTFNIIPGKQQPPQYVFFQFM